MQRWNEMVLDAQAVAERVGCKWVGLADGRGCEVEFIYIQPSHVRGFIIEWARDMIASDAVVVVWERQGEQWNEVQL